MDYFKINKYSSVEENILYIASNVLELLKGTEKSFGKLVEQYEDKYSRCISLNIESGIYLAMLFLYGVGKIELSGKKIKLVE
ncbi:MAG: hypothetical protein NC489_44550 [Ruminococcus flavefaciens]|nr:hypothetical protein [Ruminococcus flavefaciens]